MNTLFTSLLAQVATAEVAANFRDRRYAPQVAVKFTQQDWENLGASKEVAQRLVASLRLYLVATQPPRASQIGSPADIVSAIAPLLIGKTQERLAVIYLDPPLRILSVQLSTIGSSDESMVDVRGILREALRLNATSIAIAHNHPSGDCEPSQTDKFVTRDLAEAAGLMKIELIDHIIIGNNADDYTSIRNCPDCEWCFDPAQASYKTALAHLHANERTS